MKFIELLLYHSGGMFEATHYAQACEVSRLTIAGYLAVLEMTSMVSVIRPYSKKRTFEIVSMPKLYGFDTGFVSFVKGWDTLRNEDYGILWEQLVLNELQATRPQEKIYYWRDKQGHEIDFLLISQPDSPLVIECKWRLSGFDDTNLRIFRNRYPRGENYVVAGDCTRAHELTFNKIKVHVIGLNDVANIGAKKQHLKG